jgi:hypothetical protein
MMVPIWQQTTRIGPVNPVFSSPRDFHPYRITMIVILAFRFEEKNTDKPYQSGDSSKAME